MNGVNIDMLTGKGTVAQKLMASGFNVNALRTNATLRKDEWIHFDNAVIQIARHRLNVVGDLVSRGLRYPIANALGVTRVEWERVGDMTGADITMSGISQGENDRVGFDLAGMPLPIIHKDFNLNIRHLEASRKNGQPLDTTMVQFATRKVSEAIESLTVLGSTALGTNNTIYGLTNAQYRNTGSVTATWVTATGAQIVTDVLKMIQMAYDDNMYGPFMLYVPTAVYTHLAEDYKAESDKTILARIKEIPGISDVKASEYLTNSNVVLVQMTADVIDLIDGIQPTLVEWESHGGFVLNFKVLAIMVPRVRNDQKNQSGIVHFS